MKDEDRHNNNALTSTCVILCFQIFVLCASGSVVRAADELLSLFVEETSAWWEDALRCPFGSGGLSSLQQRREENTET